MTRAKVSKIFVALFENYYAIKAMRVNGLYWTKVLAEGLDEPELNWFEMLLIDECIWGVTASFVGNLWIELRILDTAAKNKSTLHGEIFEKK